MDFNQALRAMREDHQWVRRLDWPEGQYAFRRENVPEGLYEFLQWRNGLNLVGFYPCNDLCIKDVGGVILIFSLEDTNPSCQGPSIWERIRDPSKNIPRQGLEEWETVPLYGIFDAFEDRDPQHRYQIVRIEGDGRPPEGGVWYGEGYNQIIFLAQSDAETLCKRLNADHFWSHTEVERDLQQRLAREIAERVPHVLFDPSVSMNPTDFEHLLRENSRKRSDAANRDIPLLRTRILPGGGVSVEPASNPPPTFFPVGVIGGVIPDLPGPPNPFPRTARVTPELTVPVASTSSLPTGPSGATGSWGLDQPPRQESVPMPPNRNVGVIPPQAPRKFQSLLIVLWMSFSMLVVVGVSWASSVSAYHNRKKAEKRSAEIVMCNERGGVRRGSWCMPKSAEPLFEFTIE